MELKLNNYVFYKLYTFKSFATVNLNDTACAIAVAMLTRWMMSFDVFPYNWPFTYFNEYKIGQS